MSRKGFVDPILLGAGALVVVCLAVLGFSLVHFKGVGLGALVPAIPSIQSTSTAGVGTQKTPTSTKPGSKGSSATSVKTGTNNTTPAKSSTGTGTSASEPSSVPNPPPPTVTIYVSAADLAGSDPVISANGAVVIETNNMMIEATNLTTNALTGVVSLSGVNKGFSLTVGETVTEFGYSITLVRVGVTGESGGKSFLGGTLRIVQ